MESAAMALKKFYSNNQLYTVDIKYQDASHFEITLESEDSPKKKFVVTIIRWDMHNKMLCFAIEGIVYKTSLMGFDEQSVTLYLINYATQIILMRDKDVHKDHTFPLPSRQSLVSDPVLKSPLAGRVIKFFVTDGEHVTQGKPLVVIESMKMENELCAPFDGIVKSLSIEPGNVVEQGQVLIIFAKKGEEHGTSKNEYGEK